MDFLVPLVTLALVHLMAVISPGQSFLMVSRTALASGRGAAVAASLGMGIGAVLWATGAIVGLAILFKQAAWLYTGLKIIGGGYLIYLGLTAWRQARAPLDLAQTPAAGGLEKRRAFWIGLLTMVTNPKVIIFFGSIFVALLPAAPPPWVITTALAIVFVNEFAWYCLVSVLFSSDRPRRAYLRFKGVIDRLTGAFLGALGVRLMLDTR